MQLLKFFSSKIKTIIHRKRRSSKSDGHVPEMATYRTPEKECRQAWSFEESSRDVEKNSSTTKRNHWKKIKEHIESSKSSPGSNFRTHGTVNWDGNTGIFLKLIFYFIEVHNSCL